MIFYVTKELNDFYDALPEPGSTSAVQQLSDILKKDEKGNELLEWGANAFFFDYRMNIQLINYASHLTLFLMYFPYEAFENLGEYFQNALDKLYEGDKVMLKCLDNMYHDSTFLGFDSLYKKSIIHALNNTYRDFLNNGKSFVQYVRGNVLHSVDVNHDCNFKYKFTRVVKGKKEEYFAGKLFRELVKKAYYKK